MKAELLSREAGKYFRTASQPIDQDAFAFLLCLLVQKLDWPSFECLDCIGFSLGS